MSHVDDNQSCGHQDESSLGTGARMKMANKTLDAEAVDGERLVSLFNSKRGCAANLSRRYNEFNEAVRDGCSVSVAQNRIQDLEDAFISFKETYEKYYDLAAIRNPEKLRDCELQFQEMESLFKRAHCMLDGMVRGQLLQKLSSKGSQRGLAEDEISLISGISSKSSSSRARAMVAAKRASLQAKLQFCEKLKTMESEQLKLRLEMEGDMERQKLEHNMAREQLKIEAEIYATEAEENTLIQFIGDEYQGLDNQVNCADKTDLNNSVPDDGWLAADHPKSSHASLLDSSKLVNGHVTTMDATHLSHDTSTGMDLAANHCHSDVRGWTPARNSVSVADASAAHVMLSGPAAMRPTLVRNSVSVTDASATHMMLSAPAAMRPTLARNSVSVADASATHVMLSAPAAMHPMSIQNLSGSVNTSAHVAVPSKGHGLGMSMPTTQLNPLADEWDSSPTKKLIDVMSLPKTSLSSFNGDPLKYWLFMNAFDSCVDKATVDPGLKLNRLLEYCTGKAAKLIQSCAIMRPAEGYTKARQLLRERFGNDYKISEAWITEICDGAPVKANNPESIQDLADDVRCCVETLRAMNMMGEIDSRVRMTRILGRLPLFIQTRWRKEAVSSYEKVGYYPNIDDLARFLEKISREVNDPVFGYVADQKNHKEKLSGNQTRSKGFSFNAQTESVEEKPAKGESDVYVNLSQSYQDSCVICHGKHAVWDCNKFKKMSPTDRLGTAKSNRLCFNCLLAGKHIARWCKAPSKCSCGKRHNKLLHEGFGKESTHGFSPRGTNSADKGEPVKSMACGFSDMKCAKISLPIVSVRVRGLGQDEFIYTHALLDTGSDRTFCSKELLRNLRVNGPERSLSLETLQGVSDAKAAEVSLEITGAKGKRKLIVLPRVLALDRLPNLQGGSLDPCDIRKWKHLQNLEIPNKMQVKLLIGQDNAHVLRPLESRYGGDEEPYAVRTVLGWTINGPVGVCSDEATSLTTISAFIQDSSDIRLDNLVQQFWKIDMGNITEEESALSIEDHKVLQLWDDTTLLTRGHYEMKIPFRHESPGLPDNQFVAKKRLDQLSRRLRKNPHIQEKYNSEINKMVEKGFAEEVCEADQDSDACARGKVWYLPHHNVVNVNKPEKFRIVFDCAAKHMDISLNQVCLQGPDLMNGLLGVLLRFREGPVAIMGDIQCMFHQVKVSPEDRNVLRFLWWKDGVIDSDVVVYRMTSHLFGGVWSPSCASYALRQTAQDNSDQFPPDILEAVKVHFYVDDCLLSVADTQTAIRMVTQLCELLSRGGFVLTKWMSNSQDVLRAIPAEKRANPIKNFDLDVGTSLPTERALGVCWNMEIDDLGVHQKRLDSRVPICTRREMLSMMSTVYDPLGMLGPYVIVAKMIFQDECRLGKGWDECLSPSNLTRWLKWLDDLPILQNFHVRRCLIPDNMPDKFEVELHHFCDSSERAFGAVSYVRAVDLAGIVHCSFLVAKSRLAPMKQVTIPRLELMAAVLGVQIDCMVRRELRLTVKTSTFWTDSMIVLHYLHNTTKRFKTFVANRVARILNGSSPSQWRHVGTNCNPADDLSRGLDAQQLVSCSRWSRGPAFLWQDETVWPKVRLEVTDTLVEDCEVKREARVCAVAVEDLTGSVHELLSRYSCWQRLKKAIAWLQRFITWLRSSRKSVGLKYLQAEELKLAEIAIVKILQGKVYDTELASLKGKGTVTKGSSIYKLDPYVASDGILRVKGRLQLAPLEDSMKHPAILPRNHHVSMLIVRYTHADVSGHSGREHVLSLVREKFWITKARPLINKILLDCVICKRRRGVFMEQRMADLPVDRVSPCEPPFTNVGVDCFGPFLVKKGRSREKRYGCLFTCLSIRAVHIEKLDSMDTDSFINAFMRFSARRGTPKLVRSDNGTNFTGADRELRKDFERCRGSVGFQHFLQKKEMSWEFNPPAASHMGGVWERQIRTVRKVLTSIVGEQILDDERLNTLFCQVESIINSRPLTIVSDDPTDMEPITPDHLLLLRRGAEVPPGPFVKEDCFRRRWRHVQYLADCFWKRWIHEYLPTLQLRPKWQQQHRNLAVGDIVVITDAVTARKEWPLARVVDVKISQDGLVRSATVQTATTTLDRPVAKLCLLETVSASTD